MPCRLGSDSLLIGLLPELPLSTWPASLTLLSILLKAFNLSLKLLSASIILAGVCSLPDRESSKLASFCLILSEISVDTLRAGCTNVSIFSSHPSSGLGGEGGEGRDVGGGGGGAETGAGDMELVEAEYESEDDLSPKIINTRSTNLFLCVDFTFRDQLKQTVNVSQYRVDDAS